MNLIDAITKFTNNEKKFIIICKNYKEKTVLDLILSNLDFGYNGYYKVSYILQRKKDNITFLIIYNSDFKRAADYLRGQRFDGLLISKEIKESYKILPYFPISCNIVGFDMPSAAEIKKILLERIRDGNLDKFQIYTYVKELL